MLAKGERGRTGLPWVALMGYFFVLHLCSVKKFSGAKSENWPILYRQNVMQETLLSIVSNLPSSSQAGRRGFDPRLPLHLSTCRIKFALIGALTLSGPNALPLSSSAHVAGSVAWPEFAQTSPRIALSTSRLRSASTRPFKFISRPSGPWPRSPSHRPAAPSRSTGCRL